MHGKPGVRRRWWARLLAFGAVAAVTGLLVLPVCDQLHRCGCVAPWAGADASCNVHEALGPHCPWCEHPALGGAAIGSVLVGQWLVLGALLRRGASWPVALGGSLAALAPLALLAGALAWLPTDYPHFLAHDARQRLGLPDGPISCVRRGATVRPAVAVCCRRP